MTSNGPPRAPDAAEPAAVTGGAPDTAATRARVFRLSPMAYLAVLVLVFCVAPLAFTSDGSQGAPVAVGAQTALLAIPVLAALVVARTATIVDTAGVSVRLPFGRRTLRWTEVRGLSVGARSVYAVTDAGALRLPCVRTADLAAVSRASGGHLPEVAEPVAKHPPQRRRRARR